MASRCSHALRPVSRTRPVLRLQPRLSPGSSSSRCLATAASTASTSAPGPPPPSPPQSASPSNPKINQLVDDISGLTLLQAADLVSLLKTRLNIQEIAMPAAAPAAAAPVEEAPVEEKPKEKTIFTVILESIDAASKAKVIKEIKALVPNLTLMEAKKYVESLPKVVKENIPKEDAEKLKATFEAIGGVVKLD